MGVISQSRDQARIALASLIKMKNDRTIIVTDDVGIDRWKMPDLEARKILFGAMPGFRVKETASYNMNEQLSVYGPLPVITWDIRNLTITSAVIARDWMKENRLEFISWVMYMLAIKQADGYGRLTWVISNDFIIKAMYKDDIDGRPVSEQTLETSMLYQLLSIMVDVEVNMKKHDQNNVHRGADSAYYRMLNDLERFIGQDTDSNSKSKGLSALFEGKPVVDGLDERVKLENQIELAAPKLKNGLSARTWGFEIEVPDAKGVDAPSGIEKGTDGSLRSYLKDSDDCNCGCSDCTYHDCDCDNCDSQNTDPEHCDDESCQGDCDSAEYRSIGGIQRVKHSGMYELCKALNIEDAEINDTAGTHIHVYAADLTTNQVGQVMAIYKWLENYMGVFAGRANNGYAKHVPVKAIANALSTKGAKLEPVKQLAVNVTYVATRNIRGTIEFRQMDCNLDADRISLWAWLVRGFVECAKRGATMRDFMKVNDFNDVFNVLARFDYKLESENPGMVVPGSKTDVNYVKVQSHVLV